MSDQRPRTPPSDRFTPEHQAFDLHVQATALEAEPTPKAHGRRQKTLYKNAGRTIALFVLDAEAGLAEHATPGVVTIHAIEGEIDVAAGAGPEGPGTVHHLRPGVLLALAPGVRHDVRARTRAVFLLEVSLEPGASNA